jgi:hypothetical protein
VSITKETDAAASRALKKSFSALTPPDSTLASAKVGVKQQRLPHKRKHKPTQFFGTRIGGRGSHIIASSNPTLTAPRLILEQRQYGNELLFPTGVLPIKESFGAPAANVDPIPIDLTGTQNSLPEIG